MIVRTVKIIVPGLPQGKGAARHTRKGFTYTPTKTRDYMDCVAEEARKVCAYAHQCACSMKIEAFFPIPESYSKKQKELIKMGMMFYTKKPDTDNLSKIKDALKGIAFSDDAVVWKEEVTKYYSATPRLEITIFYEYGPIDGVLGYKD